MFKVYVTDAVKLHDNLITVAGVCENKGDFTSRLTDDFGNTYNAHIPLDVTLVPDDTKIMLGITGSHDAEAFIGHSLRGV
jgi:hypothetical protein